MLGLGDFSIRTQASGKLFRKEGFTIAYTANVLQVMIASPSDVSRERHIVRDVINEWNAIHAKDRKTVLMAIAWETHSTPDVGNRPQAIINGQLLMDADLLVAAFWTRVGTPTGIAPSGTVEEIEGHIAAGKPAMIYFSSTPVRPESVDPEQYSALKNFKDSLKARALFEEYENLVDFRAKFSRQLAQKIISHFPDKVIRTENEGNDERSSSSNGARTAEPVPPMSSASRKLLVEASEDQQGLLMSLQTLDGYHVQANGQEFVTGDARSAAQWKSAVEELARLKLIEDRGGLGEVFFVTDNGYRVSDLLRQQELPSAPTLQFGQWHSGGGSGYPTNVPGGSPSWISIRNTEVLSPQLARNVKVQIEWVNDAKTARFTVSEAEWYVRRGLPGKRVSESWSSSAEIEGGDEQSCILLVTGPDGQLWVYKHGTEPLGVLDFGHWTANVLVTSDNAQGFEGSLGFTLARGGLTPDQPAFVLRQAVRPRLG